MYFFKEGLGQFAKDIQSVLMYFTNFSMKKKKDFEVDDAVNSNHMYKKSSF